jgi:cell division transport system ATP-binding protein
MIQFQQVHKSYGSRQAHRDSRMSALTDVSFDIPSGAFVLLAGHSGAGKTTLLKLVAAVEPPTSGTIRIDGQDVGAIKARAIPYLRRNLGLIFQDQKLLADRSVFANVMLPLMVTGTPPRDAAKRARAALDKVGLLNREKLNPLALSGGDQQRLAIARAIVNRPAILIADEPTANLDQAAALRIIEIFRQFNQVGVTVLLATHDEHLLEGFAPQVLRLEHGRLVNPVGNTSAVGATAAVAEEAA